MNWSFMFNHGNCEQCKKFKMDAVMLASARGETGATYSGSDGHSATAYLKENTK